MSRAGTVLTGVQFGRYDRRPPFQRRQIVTVCVGAICIGPGNIAVVVGASDRMLTAGGLTEYEPPKGKFFQFGKTVIGLFAGPTAATASICRATQAAVALLTPPVDTWAVATAFSAEYVAFRRRFAEVTILSHYGLTFDSFIARQRDLAPELVQRISSELRAVDIEVEALILGVDQLGGHVYAVRNPGAIINGDADGFAAIGVGQWHAESQFMFAKFSQGWLMNPTLWLAHYAKRRSEAAPGVGRETDMIAISLNEGAVSVRPEIVKALDKIYDSTRRMESNALKKAQVNLEAFLATFFQQSVPLPSQPTPAPPAEGAAAGAPPA